MPAPFDVLDLLPPDTPDYMAGMWLACVQYALGDEAIVAQFREETGTTWVPGRTPVDQMIDKATGADVAFLTAFVQWVNARLWGPLAGPAVDGPDGFRE